MSHRTAATALLLVSLPYGLALPQIIPRVSEVTRVPKPLTLPYEPGYEPSSVTVVGTVVDATTDPTPLETIADAISDALPEDPLPTLDDVASILPFILPGLLPVETDLPPIDTPDVDPSDLPVLDPENGDGTFADDDLPDSNDLEVIDLPAPSEVPYGDDGLTIDPLDPILSDPIPDLPDFPELPDFPDFSDFPDEKTVPISTFNAVVQPLISAIQTLLNALPGNFAPPLPGIFIHPLLPTKTPDIFIDPILPTETPDIFIDPLLPTETFDSTAATATDAIDALLDSLLDPIPSIADSVATDLPFVKRQDPADAERSSIIAIIGPILDAIRDLIGQIPSIGPAVANAVSEVEDAVPYIADQVVDVPAADTQVPVPTFTLPALSLPTIPTDLPVDVPAIPELPSAEVPLPSLPADVPVLPVEVPDLTSSGIPAEVLNVPIPDIDGIDWSQYESPPFAEVPSPSSDDIPIPTDVLNVPVPDFDEFGVPIDAPLDGSDPPAAIPSLPLPTSPDLPGVDGSGVPVDAPVDAVSDLPNAPSVLPALLDWPFNDWEIPDTLAPDASGELPDLSDLPIPSSVLSVSVPDSSDLGVPLDVPTDIVVPAIPTDAVAGLVLPAPLPELTLVPDLPQPTGLFDVPVPEGFEDVGDLPAATDVAASLPLPTIDEPSTPTDILNIPVPDVDQFGVPLDLPTDSGADLPFPTNFLDVPVPEGFEDVGDLPAATDVAASLPLPTIDEPSTPTDILNIPVPDVDQFGVPLDLPTDSGADLPFPTNFLDVPVPEGFEDLGEPFDEPASALPTDTVADFADPAIPDAVLNVPVPDLDNLDAPVDLSTEPVAALPTSLFDVPVPEGFEDLGDSLDGSAAALPTDAVPDVQSPAIPLDVLDVPVPNLDDLNGPVERSSILPAPAQPGILPAPVQPSILPAPALPKAAFGAGFPIQALPDIPLIFPSAPTDASPTLPSNVVPVVPVVAPPALPTAAASTPSPAVPAVPALPIVPTLQGIVPSGVATTPVVPVVAVLPAVPTLQGIAPKVPLATPRLPFQIRGQVHHLMERDMMAAQAAQVAPAKLPIGSDIALTLVKSLLTLVRALVDVLPVVGKTVPSLDASLPAAVATILPALPTVPAIPAVPEVASALLPVPDVGAAASTVTGAVSAVPGISEVLSTEGDAVPKVPLAFDSGIEKRRLPLARRATEIQQGSASNWESFLGELDEFKQEELHGLIQDSAAAVTHNDMKNLASKLEADFKDFSDESKAQLLNGWAPGSVLTAVQERSMRNGKRQTGIPGAQSIGPDLDDAQKVDLSGILGPAGTLDPFDQLHASGSGKFADDLPEGYLAPSQAVSTFDQLDDSSVDRGLSPHLSSILGAAGTLDPNGMLGSQVGRPGSVADGAAEENPYADLNPSWDPAFQGGSKETLPGLEATLQAAKGNHVGGKAPRLPFAPRPGGSAAAAQERAAEQGRVLKWFNRFVRPSGRSDVDAKIVQ